MTALLLHIDTSMDTAFVGLSADGKLLAIRTNTVQKEHATFLHKAIQELMLECQVKLAGISAISVTEGPGSYTGLRVGLSAAKGLCYALDKPLLCIGTLPMIAQAAINHFDVSDAWFCPMIDARRMEVFTALYNQQLQEQLPPQSLILNNDSLSAYLKEKKIIFCGNGATKAQAIITSPQAAFFSGSDFSQSMSYLSYKAFISREFSDLVASKPLYIKEPQIFG